MKAITEWTEVSYDPRSDHPSPATYYSQDNVCIGLCFVQAQSWWIKYTQSITRNDVLQ